MKQPIAIALAAMLFMLGFWSPSDAAATLAKATFSGGCFWCMEQPFDGLPGVISTTVGYTGGQTIQPTYQQVSSGTTGHAESVQVVYDPQQVSYETLLDTFWHNVDPLDAGGQFCDRGNQYRTSIFVHDAQQRQLAERTKRTLEATGVQPIATQIVAAGSFYPAEDYHQDYYLKNPRRYRFYRYACGRDQRLEQVWGSSAPHRQSPHSPSSLPQSPST